MSNNSINGKNTKSTDYLVGYLQDDQKMIPNPKSYRGNHFDDNTNNSSSLSSKKSSKSTKSNSTCSDASNLDEYLSNDDKQNYSDNKEKNYNDDDGKSKDKQDTNLYDDDDDDYNNLSENKKLLKRLDLIRKLGELAQRGVQISKEYTLADDYFTMKYEYMLHSNIRAKKNFENWGSSILLNCVYGIEILNEKYDPFSLKLTGWAEQINGDINNVNEVFGEIYEKYNKPGKSMSPELKLFFMVIGAGVKFHITNTMGTSNNAANNIRKQQDINERQKQMYEERIRKDNEFALSEMKRMEELNKHLKIIQENNKRREELEELKRQQQLEELKRAQQQLEQEEQHKYNGYNRNEDISRQLNQITDKIKSNRSINTDKSSNSRKKPSINVNIESNKSDNYSTTTSNSEVESSVASKQSGNKSTYSRSKYNKTRLNFNI